MRKKFKVSLSTESYLGSDQPVCEDISNVSMDYVTIYLIRYLNILKDIDFSIKNDAISVYMENHDTCTVGLTDHDLYIYSTEHGKNIQQYAFRLITSRIRHYLLAVMNDYKANKYRSVQALAWTDNMVNSIKDILAKGTEQYVSQLSKISHNTEVDANNYVELQVEFNTLRLAVYEYLDYNFDTDNASCRTDLKKISNNTPMKHHHSIQLLDQYFAFIESIINALIASSWIANPNSFRHIIRLICTMAETVSLLCFKRSLIDNLTWEHYRHSDISSDPFIPVSTLITSKVDENILKLDSKEFIEFYNATLLAIATMLPKRKYTFTNVSRSVPDLNSSIKLAAIQVYLDNLLTSNTNK